MNYEELLALLDIDAPSELVYFEQFADLTEEPGEISIEALISLVEGMEGDVLSELVEGYFEDVLKFVPDEEEELYMLISNIGTTLSSLAQNISDEDGVTTFVEEFYKFRTWYLIESAVLCVNNEEGAEREMPLMEALTEYRVNSFTEEDCTYDFSGALDYPLEEYVVSLNPQLEDDYGDGDFYGEDEDYRDPPKED